MRKRTKTVVVVYNSEPPWGVFSSLKKAERALLAWPRESEGFTMAMEVDYRLVKLPKVMRDG